MDELRDPRIDKTAFTCPHCRAYSAQAWLDCAGSALVGNKRIPSILNANDLEKAEAGKEKSAFSRQTYEFTIRAVKRAPFLSPIEDTGYTIGNIFLSRCTNCSEIGIWVYDQLIWPATLSYPPAHFDMPEELLRDYDEAGSILNFSPRGAAALLRLVVQKLCVILGEDGKNINEDIASLVKKGLNVKVQKMLDTVRVIGNEAVHPGSMDIKDDRAIAETLFRLVNRIVDLEISQPKQVDEIYNSLPKSKIEGIEKRDS